MGQEAEPLIPIDSAIASTVDDANKASIPQANRAGSVPCFFQPDGAEAVKRFDFAIEPIS